MISGLTIDKLSELGADFAGYKRFAHPNMVQYASFQKKGIYYFDLEKTLQKFNDLILKLKEVDESGKKILFVATGSRVRNIIGKFIAKTDHFYIDNRWLGGILTNFNLIQKRLFLLQDLYSQEKKGLIDTWSKKEKLQFKIQKSSLEVNLKGILEMKVLPDYLFIVGPQVQKIALKEAQKLNIPVFAISKVDSDPKQFVEFLPINDGSIPVLELIMNEIVIFCFKKNSSSVVNSSDKDVGLTESIDASSLVENKIDEKS